MNATEAKDFNNSIHCLDCAYSDLGYNGSKLCLPKTKACQPIFPYDLMVKSRIIKLDKIAHKDISEQDKNKIIKRQYEN